MSGFFSVASLSTELDLFRGHGSGNKTNKILFFFGKLST